MDKEMANNEVRLLCERILNESWSKVLQYKSELEVILERGTIENESDQAIVFAAADAFLQRVNLEIASDEAVGLSISVPCGRKHTSCDQCLLSKCDYFVSS